MRFLACLLSLIFISSTVDFAPAIPHTNPRTCCGRSVCDCTHAKGAFCPMKKMNMRSHHHETQAPKPVQSLIFKQAPCRTNTPKSILREYSRDFELPASIQFPADKPSETLRAQAPLLLDFPAVSGIDRPPRLASLSF